MPKDFMKVLIEEGVLADGAIGTEIYRRGVFINRCYDELNLTNPDLIKKIHRDYLDAGSKLIKTKTFTANRAALSSYGLEAKIKDINSSGVRLAKKVARKDAFVAGSLGPVSTSSAKHISKDEWSDIFREQILALADAGADLILLETFTNLDELDVAIRVSKEVTDLPVAAHFSVSHVSEEEYSGFEPEDALHLMVDAGADVVGVNCSDGPQGVFDTLKRMVGKADKPLSAMPNAGLPRVVQGRMLYLATWEYMAEYARRYAQLGVVLIGGCCGTTPKHIREMKLYLKALKPNIGSSVQVVREERVVKEKGEPPPLEERSAFGAVLGKKFVISVEIDPPLGVDPKAAVEGAKYLKELGVDAVNIADGPRAMPRMSPIALGKIIEDEVGIETIVHYCCRDRNILGMQMDLLGAEAMGLNNMLIVTGDPPKMGNYPQATAVFDIDSIGLIGFVSNLNSGLDFANRPIRGATRFVIGCGCNPGAVDLDIEVERFRQKVEAGAEFVFSQPIYDMEILDRFLKRTKDIKNIPFFVGILPLSSLRNAEFLHNEVPGMQVPDDVMERLRAGSTKEGQQKIGAQVAAEILKHARALPRIGGAYIFPPLGRYQLVEELLKS